MKNFLFLFCFTDVTLEDTKRFPNHEAELQWADKHIEWLTANKDIDLVNQKFWSDWIAEARRARQPWYELKLARIDYKEPWRLRRLRDLKDLIGEEAYLKGEMPPVVNPESLWRFR